MEYFSKKKSTNICKFIVNEAYFAKIYLTKPQVYSIILHIDDFYKVYGYACIYQSNTDRIKEIDPEELTLTFVCSHYPRELLDPKHED